MAVSSWTKNNARASPASHTRCVLEKMSEGLCCWRCIHSDCSFSIDGFPAGHTLKVCPRCHRRQPECSPKAQRVQVESEKEQPTKPHATFTQGPRKRSDSAGLQHDASHSRLQPRPGSEACIETYRENNGFVVVKPKSKVRKSCINFITLLCYNIIIGKKEWCWCWTCSVSLL